VVSLAYVLDVTCLSLPFSSQTCSIEPNIKSLFDLACFWIFSWWSLLLFSFVVFSTLFSLCTRMIFHLLCLSIIVVRKIRVLFRLFLSIPRAPSVTWAMIRTQKHYRYQIKGVMIHMNHLTSETRSVAEYQIKGAELASASSILLYW